MKSKNILIAEDDVNINNLLKEALEREGYVCRQAFSGTEAILLLEREEPSVILLDLMLPGMTGEQVLAKIRENSDIPVIVLTAKDGMDEKLNLLQNGADDYITKPYNPTILLLRINALLKRAAASSANNSTFYRGMEILPQKGVIKYNDGRDEMLLTKNEMTIFMCLLAKKDRIVSRDELMTELWNNEEYLNDNALTVNISRLRARFKDIGIEDVIETRKGQGYILV